MGALLLLFDDSAPVVAPGYAFRLHRQGLPADGAPRPANVIRQGIPPGARPPVPWAPAVRTPAHRTPNVTRPSRIWRGIPPGQPPPTPPYAYTVRRRGLPADWRPRGGHVFRGIPPGAPPPVPWNPVVIRRRGLPAGCTRRSRIYTPLAPTPTPWAPPTLRRAFRAPAPTRRSRITPGIPEAAPNFPSVPFCPAVIRRHGLAPDSRTRRGRITLGVPQIFITGRWAPPVRRRRGLPPGNPPRRHRARLGLPTGIPPVGQPPLSAWGGLGGYLGTHGTGVDQTTAGLGLEQADAQVSGPDVHGGLSAPKRVPTTSP